MLVVIGIITAVQLPVAQYPQISPPTVMVSTSYTGAKSTTMISDVNGHTGVMRTSNEAQNSRRA